MSQKSTDTEKLSTINIRITLKGDKAALVDWLDGLIALVKTQEATFISIDYNSPKDSS